MSEKKSGWNYWISQIVICAVAAVVMSALGVLLIVIDDEEPGRGVMLIFAGLLFAGCLIWLVRSYRRMSVTQRAIYAWAIMQQHGADVPDGATMAMAARAQAGTLRPDELQWLIGLDRSNPYPADTRATQTDA